MRIDESIVQWLTSLNTGSFKGEPRPHKPVLLLSVLEPAARDCIGTTDELLTHYRRKQIVLPADESLWPGRDYLEWHRANKYLRE